MVLMTALAIATTVVVVASTANLVACVSRVTYQVWAVARVANRDARPLVVLLHVVVAVSITPVVRPRPLRLVQRIAIAAPFVGLRDIVRVDAAVDVRGSGSVTTGVAAAHVAAVTCRHSVIPSFAARVLVATHNMSAGRSAAACPVLAARELVPRLRHVPETVVPNGGLD